MTTRSLHRGLAFSLMGLCDACVLRIAAVVRSPTSPGETSFLSGTWNGTLTITRSGQPDVTGPATWTFELVPQTGRQNFNTTIRSQNAWIPVTTTSTIVLTPTADPPGQIGGTGHYSSPRGCTGDFVTTGNATASAIDATFDGIDCDDGSGVSVTVQWPHPSDEVSPPGFRSQDRAKAKIDACGIGKEETRHPRWERCAAPMGARERPRLFSGV